MSRRWPSVVGAAFAVGVALLALHEFAPPTLGGEHLAVAAGAQPDPHLLTGWAWRLLFGPVAIQNGAVRLWSALVLFAVLLAVFATLRRQRLTVVAAVYSIILVTSPLVIGVVLDPLGGEDFISLGLTLAMALNVAGLWRTSSLTRAVLVAALALQDVRLVPAALVYIALSNERTARRLLCELGALAAAIAARILLAPGTLPKFPISIDYTAGPATIIAIGFVLFGIVPIVLFSIGARSRLVLALTRPPFVKCVVLGAAAAAMGVLARTGDPSPYWLDGEACLLVGLTASAFCDKETGRGYVAVTFLSVVAVQLLLVASMGNTLPALALSQASDTIEHAAAQDARDSVPICVVTNASGERHVLANGALFSLSSTAAVPIVVHAPGRCLRAAATPDLIVVDDMLAVDWGTGGSNLTRATDIAASAELALPVGTGIVSPDEHASTPTGFGAFGQVIDTPVGPVGAFTVLSGFSYRFACVPPGGRLVFAVAGIPYRAFSYEVTLDDGNGAKRILAQTIPGPASGGAGIPEGTPYEAAQAWQFHTIPLPPTQSCRALAFSVPSRPNVYTNWVTFAGVSLLRDARARVARGT